MTKAKILFYDIETSPLQAWVWGCGDQTVRSAQLVEGHSRYGIICICYAWNDGTPVKSIDWGYDEQSTKEVVRQFDEIIKQADHVIGKNSARFDNKMLNAARMFAGLPGMPDWTKYTDDLERQMRKYFRLPSQALDYISHELGLGGKTPMSFQDWIDIVTKNKNGEKALAKMIKYCKKDVTDTRTIWNYLNQHFEPKFNMATYMGERNACIKCGNTQLAKHDFRFIGKQKYQRFHPCSECGYSGNRQTVGVRQNGKME